jgi:hypothetical protein
MSIPARDVMVRFDLLTRLVEDVGGLSLLGGGPKSPKSILGDLVRLMKPFSISCFTLPVSLEAFMYA